MTMECTQARSLIPSYLDGELSEAQAAPLRKHLLDCQPCRADAQAERNLARWFSAREEVEIPAGFAARVARRAFAGDTGERSGEAAAVAAEMPGVLRFVLRATAAAALVTLGLAVALRSVSLPEGSRLMADTREEIGLDEAIEKLDCLNAEEARARPAPGHEGRHP